MLQPYGTAIFLVRKKDGSWRMVADLSEINSISSKTALQLPLLAQWLTYIQVRKYLRDLMLCLVLIF